MSDFLRDVALKNLLVTEERLIALNELLEEIVEDVNNSLEENSADKLQITFVLRFDNKGFVLHDIDEVIDHFRHCRRVQKLIIGVNTSANASNSAIGPTGVPFQGHGKCIHIQFAVDDTMPTQGPNFEAQVQSMPSYMLVSDDSKGWMEGSFGRLKGKHRGLMPWKTAMSCMSTINIGTSTE